ncbi:MAG TPA: hypothetical protein VFJ19_02640 [Nocardioidaceae bacterium]|nr:hypothetical protein [Nocardioidaceae bacterium]
MRIKLTGAAASAVLVGSTALAGLGGVAGAAAPAAGAAESACQMGNGVKHVITIVFDNVHFSRDNPNVPSDLEQMPHLLRFLERNGVVFSNTHTPMIAHTADDSLSIYTGLYGDRHGQPVSNSYRTYNPDGTTDPAGTFAYWTDPVYDTLATPTAGHDQTPTMVFSPRVPARSGHTARQTPAPWVPFTRAGCSVGDYSTANMVLENTKLDLPTVFGANSPEVQQYNADPDKYKDDETTDYVGIAVHCSVGDPTCTKAQAVKFGQHTPSRTAVPDRLPTEPGGYHHFKALFGAKYTDSQVGGGKPDVTHHGFKVTGKSGNLVDIFGHTLRNAYTGKPGFVGFDPTAGQTLAYLADMQEAGVPVTYGYISDLHAVKAFDKGPCTTDSANDPETGKPIVGAPIGPGDSCYAQNTHRYDRAFHRFFKRLRADGITPANTVFQISAEENDQFDGANVGRATVPTPRGCTGGAHPCHYSSTQIGELQANLTPLLAHTKSAETAYDLEPQGAAIYVHGRPRAAAPRVRQLERDTAAMRADNPYSGAKRQHIVKYQAGALEERILHMRTADPLRTPTYTMFPVPDYYFAKNPDDPAVEIDNGYAYNHGYYTPNIDITWSSFVGPGVAHRGLDGPTPANGNQPQDPNSHNTVPQASKLGTWVEETDLRPTLMYLTGLRDDYRHDGSVLRAALRHHPRALRRTEALARVYRQLNSAVGRFATDTLIADSRALASGTPGNDSTYRHEQRRLRNLAHDRDVLATRIKGMLHRADDLGRTPNTDNVHDAIRHAQRLLARAHDLTVSLR